MFAVQLGGTVTQPSVSDVIGLQTALDAKVSNAAKSGLAFVWSGLPAANAAHPPVPVPFAGIIRASNAGKGAARVAASVTAVGTIYRASTPGAAGTAIGTATFTASDSAPAVTLTGGIDQTIATTDFIWAAWGAQDATLADVTISLFVERG